MSNSKKTIGDIRAEIDRLARENPEAFRKALTEHATELEAEIDAAWGRFAASRLERLGFKPHTAAAEQRETWPVITSVSNDLLSGPGADKAPRSLAEAEQRFGDARFVGAEGNAPLLRDPLEIRRGGGRMSEEDIRKTLAKMAEPSTPAAMLGEAHALAARALALARQAQVRPLSSLVALDNAVALLEKDKREAETREPKP